MRLPVILQGFQRDAFNPQRPVPVFAVVDHCGRLPGARAGRPSLPVGQVRLEADVGASRLPYILTAGFINDFVESLYLFAPLALYILLLPDRWFRARLEPRDAVCRHAATHRRLAVPDRDRVLLLRGVRRALQSRRVRLPRLPGRGVHRHLGSVPGGQGAAGRDARCDHGSLRPAPLARARPITSFGFANGSCCSRRMPSCCCSRSPTTRPMRLSLSANRVENELLQNGHSSFFLAARTSDIDYESYYVSASPRRTAHCWRRNSRVTTCSSRNWRPADSTAVTPPGRTASAS